MIKTFLTAQLVTINDTRRGVSGKLKLCLLVDENKQGLWWTPTSKELGRLKNEMGIANDCDLKGRECTMTYKQRGEYNGWFSNRNIQEVWAFTGYNPSAEAA